MRNERILETFSTICSSLELCGIHSFIRYLSKQDVLIPVTQKIRWDNRLLPLLIGKMFTPY